MILSHGSYTVMNHPLVLKKWSPEFDFKQEQLTVLPIWIKLPSLPLQFWGRRSLGKIASVVGRPLHTDECTINQTRVGFARILVDVDISQAAVKSIRPKTSSGKIFEQPVTYEWFPSFCQKCQKLGHVCGQEQVVRNVPRPDRTRREPRQVSQGNEHWIRVRDGRQTVAIGGGNVEKQPISQHNQFDPLQAPDHEGAMDTTLRFGEFGGSQFDPGPSTSN